MARTEYGTTWWGQKWLDALTQIDYDNRIPRGKTYANTGRVESFKLDFKTHTVKARVKGNYDPFYTVKLRLPEISRDQVKNLLDAVAKSPLIVAKLSARELDPDILPVCEKLGIKLFPSRWNDLEMSCSCPDWAVPCKHIAAVIYKMSQEIDANPFVLFSLRGIDLPGELAKRGVSIERALKAELPTWDSILNKPDALFSGVGEFLGENSESGSIADISRALPAPQWEALPEQKDYEDKTQWLSALSKLAFEKPEFDPSAQLMLLSEKPAGYVGGDLREKIQKVLKAAAKVAKDQISNFSEHSAPVFTVNEDHPASLFCINTWGKVRPSDTLTWREFDLSVKGTTPRQIGQTRSDGSVVRIHEMFSGYLNPKLLANHPEEIEAFYNVWVIATKLMMTQAVMPQIYEPADGCFAVRWIPATSSAQVRRIVTELGRLFTDVTKPYLDILRRPVEMSAQTLGEIILSIFIESYIRSGFEKALGQVQFAEEASLFKADYMDTEDDPAALSVRLRLAEWLTVLSQSRADIKPVLTVRDPASEFDSHALEADEAADQPLTVELGFLVQKSQEADANGQMPLHYATMDTVLADDNRKSVRFDVMRMAARLSKHCPELTEVLRRGTASTRVTMQELTPLMFQSLPALRLLGVEVILPKSLRRLLTPKSCMQVDLDGQWDESQGFLGLASLLSFDWTVAVGDRQVSAEEFNRMTRQAGRIVRFHDTFMFADEKALAKIRNNIDSRRENLAKMAVLRAALTGEIDKSPVQLSEALQDALKRLFKETDVQLPNGIHATLRPYQERGYRWMMRNVHIGLGSILADDMGLGKTLQVITLLEAMRARGELAKKPALIVVPTSLITNWQREADRFAPELKLHLFYGNTRTLPQQDQAHAILTTYGTMRSSANLLKKNEFRLLILDEAQAVKNYRTSTFRTVRSIKADSVVAMSGTPVENRLMEYWSIMEATNPGLLGSAAGFKKEFADPIEAMHDLHAAERFKRVTSPFIMRRLKTDKSIISDLPEKITSDEYCTLTKEQAALYESLVKKTMNKLEAGMDQFERSSLVLQLIIQLKQICNSPLQYEKTSPYGAPEHSGKTERLFEILDELIEAGRKVLIFTQFKQMGTILQDWLKDRYGQKPPFIHGGVPQKERQAIVDRFQNDRSDRILILSLKAAGTGLNLTAASAIVHYDLWWNPAVENQATDRAYRIGQKRSVNVYRLVCADTFEEKINTMIESKKALAEMTVESGENWIGDLSNNELEEIFSLQNN